MQESRSSARGSRLDGEPGRRMAHAEPARLDVREKSVFHLAQGQDLQGRRGQSGGAYRQYQQIQENTPRVRCDDASSKIQIRLLDLVLLAGCQENFDYTRIVLQCIDERAKGFVDAF